MLLLKFWATGRDRDPASKIVRGKKNYAGSEKPLATLIKEK
jgi:hypothetical protein